MRFINSLSLTVALGIVVVVAPVRAQDAAPAPAHIAVVDGSVMLNRDGQPDQAVVNMPFVPGDRVRTTNGRVEIMFPDGTALDVDQFSQVDLDAENAIHLSEGRALLRVPRARYMTAEYELTTPATSISAVAAGEYRLAYPDPYESARADEFDRWVDSQPGAAPIASASAQYLPADLQMYGPTLDQYGGWQYDAAYGYVWYPTVAPTWRPYYDGYWAPIQPYGWTWVGMGAWSWPTHHYGRWGWHHDRWFWIPARSWAPAWVAWGAGGDYVSWCPLGWDSRPVFALSASYGDPWRGWTVMPRGAFAYTRVYVAHHRIRPERVSLASTAFVVQSRAPIAVPRAVARPGGGALGRPGIAVPRNGAADSTIYRGGARTAAPQPPGIAVPRSSPADQPTAIDRQRAGEPPTGAVVPGPPYRAPAIERPRESPGASPRVAPIAPPAAQPSQPGAVPRQDPIARPPAQAAPAQPAQAAPAQRARPQAQPRAESGTGGAQQQAQPAGGRGQGQQPSTGKAQARGKNKG